MGIDVVRARERAIHLEGKGNCAGWQLTALLFERLLALLPVLLLASD